MKEVHRILKPGGMAAVVQHRAKEGAKVEESVKLGYLPQAWLVEKMATLGFELAESSEINANAKDTADYKEGAWTLRTRQTKGVVTSPARDTRRRPTRRSDVPGTQR